MVDPVLSFILLKYIVRKDRKLLSLNSNLVFSFIFGMNLLLGLYYLHLITINFEIAFENIL